MKNKIIVLLLLMSVSVNAQLKKFQGFWMSGDTSYNTVITHNDEKDSLKIYTFSFTKNDKLIQNITKINKETFESTILIPESDFKVNAFYSIINDSIIKMNLTGSTTQTIIYEKITD
jgi:hypothetical protein